MLACYKLSLNCISTFHDGNKDDNIDLRFDLISGLAYRTYANDYEKLPISDKQKAFIIEKLKKATKRAELMTLHNMTTPKTLNSRTSRKLEV